MSAVMMATAAAGDLGAQADAEDERALMVRVVSGDRLAFRRLAERFMGRLMAVAMKICGNRQEAEDVVQDTLLRLWERAADYRPDRGPLWPWLARVATNRALDLKRRRRPEPLDEVATAALPDGRPGPEASAASAEMMRRFASAFGALPERQRAALVLVVEAGLSQRQAAAALGIGEGALESLLSRGRRTLKAALAEEGER